MKIRTIVTLALSVGLAATAQAQSTPIEQWQIIEGQGVTDNYVYIGMSRKEARTRTTNGNCDGQVAQCSFRAQDNANASVITLFFNSKNKVSDINIIQGAGISWPTTAGAVDGMTPEQVQALYPGSVIQQADPFTRVVEAARQGYRYSFNQVCNSDDQCPTFIYHSLFKRQKGQLTARVILSEDSAPSEGTDNGGFQHPRQRPFWGCGRVRYFYPSRPPGPAPAHVCRTRRSGATAPHLCHHFPP